MANIINDTDKQTLLTAIDQFWEVYKPWKEELPDKYKEAFPGTNVGHLLNQTAFQWLNILMERYKWLPSPPKQEKLPQKMPLCEYPATCTVRLINNCIKHNSVIYKEGGNKSYLPGFKKFCDLKQPWMQGKNVEPPLTDFSVGSEINLSCVARAKNQLKEEIKNEQA